MQKNRAELPTPLESSPFRRRSAPRSAARSAGKFIDGRAALCYLYNNRAQAVRSGVRNVRGAKMADSRQGGRSVRRQLKRYTRRHEELLLYMALNPHKTQREVARELGLTEAWVSIIANSNIFQERVRKMRDTYEGTVFANVQEKTQAACDLALNRLLESLDTDDVPPGFALDAATKLLDRIAGGNGAMQRAGIAGTRIGVQQNVIVATQEQLQAARSALRRVKELTAPLDSDTSAHSAPADQRAADA